MSKMTDAEISGADNLGKGNPQGVQSKPQKSGNPSGGQVATTLARGLAILRCFNVERPTLGVSEIAALIGVPQPTVWRLANALVKLGYLGHARDSGKLRLGTPVLALGYAVLATMDLPTMARAQMQAVANQFQAAVSLACREGLGMLFLERCQGPSHLLMNLPVGSVIPLATSAIGWGYLAGLSPDDRIPLISELIQTEGGQLHELKGAIEEALLFYDENGFIMNLGYFHPRVNTVSVPLMLPSDPEKIYVISCGGPSSVLTRDNLSKHVGPTLIDLANSLRVSKTG
jgi:DNA-binding IclR family transcriptional regulator